MTMYRVFPNIIFAMAVTVELVMIMFRICISFFVYHFIPCGVYVAVYILDGLIKNESDIQPDTIHGDTQAQNAPVFGLAHLLGIKLMPRIRRLKKHIFYRPNRGSCYDNIDQLFSDSINWPLIETHLPDMLRIVLSIKAVKILNGIGTKKNE